MCHAILQEPAFFRFLTRIDEELAAATRIRGCRACEGPLHVANYPRKPRGCPVAVREEYSRRLSFTCGRCDLRTTSASVRFAARRVYLAVVLMLVSPPGGASARALRDQLRIAPVTLKRWCRGWRETFPSTRFWQSVGRSIKLICGRWLAARQLFVTELPRSRLWGVAAIAIQ